MAYNNKTKNKQTKTKTKLGEITHKTWRDNTKAQFIQQNQLTCPDTPFFGDFHNYAFLHLDKNKKKKRRSIKAKKPLDEYKTATDFNL